MKFNEAAMKTTKTRTKRTFPWRRYTVSTEGAWLRSVNKAISGDGLSGGAYTYEVSKAKKFKSLREARKAIRDIGYGGTIEEISIK